jgi:GPH family glycoside/pentoside/hexuronide:cation symporter
MADSLSVSAPVGARVPATGEKIGYALGDVASNLYWKTFEAFLLFFYTDVFGLPAVSVGTLFLVARVWDAVSDPVMGVIADRTKSRHGRFRPYLLWCSLPLAAAGVLTFTTPNLSGDGKLAWAYGTYVLLMTAYTAVNIPYSALMGVLTANSQARTSVASIRFVGAFTGGLLVQRFTLDLVDWLGGGDARRGWQATMLVYGMTAVTLLTITFFSTRERVEPPADSRPRLREELSDLGHNGPWMALFAMGFWVILCFCIRGAVAAYYFKYYIGDTSLLGPYLVTGSIANILGAALTPRLIAWVDKARLYRWLMFAMSALVAGFYWVPPHAVWLVFTLNVAAGLVIGPKSPLVWSMYADSADYSEYLHGRRSTGLVFAAAVFAIKLGGAFGGAFTGWLLAWAQYAPNQAQSPESLHGMVLLMSVVPAVFGLLGALSGYFYRLDRPALERVQAELSRRREIAAQATPAA